MIRVLLLAVGLVACGAPMHSVQLVNKTPRTIAEIFIFPMGSANHGASRATLAPNASTTVKIKAGNVDVLAVSEKIRIDETQTETRTATQTLELKGPLELVFHDSDQTPAGLDKPGTLGLTFQTPAAPKDPEPEGEVVAPAP